MSCLREIFKIRSLNPYGMFHPSGPNLILSWMYAWKNARPTRSFFHSAGRLHESKKFRSEIGSDAKDCSMFARNPFGGSFVILIPFCSTATGKCGEGYDVSHKRNVSAGGFVVRHELLADAVQRHPRNREVAF